MQPSALANFNPPTPCGVGPVSHSYTQTLTNFNPPTPCGVGLRESFVSSPFNKFQSTHPMRGGTEGQSSRGIPQKISIHPPHAGWDPLHQLKSFLDKIFQSTHPMRGGTLHKIPEFFLLDISIHPPHAGWDPSALCINGWCPHFNPPTPCGVGPPVFPCGPVEPLISIHPPHAGWDIFSERFNLCPNNFNPPTPCGVGHSAPKIRNIHSYFNPPTPCGVGRPCTFDIRPRFHFNPPTPCGVGQAFMVSPPGFRIFQSTHPMRGGTQWLLHGR